MRPYDARTSTRPFNCNARVKGFLFLVCSHHTAMCDVGMSWQARFCSRSWTLLRSLAFPKGCAPSNNAGTDSPQPHSFANMLNKDVAPKIEASAFQFGMLWFA